MAFFLETPQPELAQGDIIRVCVYGSLPPVQVVRRWDKKPDTATVFPHPLPSSKGVKRLSRPLFSEPGLSEEVVFDAYEGQCLVISETCVAIAKAENQAQSLVLTESQKAVPWHVAPLRRWPFTQVQTPEGVKDLGELIESGLVKKYWEIPRLVDSKGDEIVPHSYVDLRFLTPLKPSTLRIEERIASLSDEAIRQLQAKLFAFFSGRPFPTSMKCPHCGQSSNLEFYRLEFEPEEEEGHGA